PGHWNRIAREVGEDQGNTLAENARMLALLDISMADALIASWDAKFAYNYVRPVTAIQNADNDPNPDTAGDTAWLPLLTTPGHPSYTSGHSSISAARAHPPAGGKHPPRHFDGFGDAAEEAANSRLYAGIHWSFDNEAGLEAGRGV